MLSIVIPTYNEGDNVFLIAKRVKEVFSNFPYELIFVDDSKDNTPEKLAHLAEHDPNVRYDHRTNQRGLGTAVVHGFKLARGTLLSVMDADLQHPPEVLRDMVRAVDLGADIVIASRFLPGGGDGGLGPLRKIVSITARYLGKATLKSLRQINDPTAGFFMVRREAIRDVELRPVGWKILIEILVRGRYSSVIEIPYHFKARAAGESKMSVVEQWNYICHLFRLTKDNPKERRFNTYLITGLTGILVNMLLYYLMVHTLVLTVALSGIGSAILTTCYNFLLNDSITWPDISAGSRWARFLKYMAASSGGIFINTVILSLLYYTMGIGYIVANVVGVGAAFLWNLTINDIWISRMEAERAAIITVSRWTAGLNSSHLDL